jgi:glutamyl-tRNA reductase
MGNNAAVATKNFYAVGLSYKNANAELRGKFRLNNDQKIQLLNSLEENNIQGAFVLSTCNRTELYGFADHPYQLIKLLCDHSNGSLEEIENILYVHKKDEAIDHVFKVGAGLESQILGDFEIISQIKADFTLAKQQKSTNGYLERLTNCVLQASKRVKNETELSTGAASVSFAAVNYIRNEMSDLANKKILLYGTGKLGRITCENLVKHSNHNSITLINRTKEKAEILGKKYSVVTKEVSQLSEEIAKSDIVFVATGADSPTLTGDHITSDRPLTILDLSIPKNVKLCSDEVKNVKVIHMDELSQMADETLEFRKNEVPKAQRIIEEIKGEFTSWIETRKFAPTITALKDKLMELQSNELSQHKNALSDMEMEKAELVSQKLVQKITSNIAMHLRNNCQEMESNLDVINEMFQLELAVNNE